MLKNIISSLSIVTLGFVLNCGGNLQTGSGSPTSLIGLDGLFSKALPSSITSIAPANSSKGVSTTPQVRVHFAADMNPASITNATITVTDAGSNAIPGTVAYNAATRTATFIPAAPLSNGTTFTVTLSTGILDTTGNPLPYAVTFSFTSVDAATVPAPEISPMEGTYGSAQTAMITCSEPGAMISYTTNGTVPTRTNGTQVAAPASFLVASPMTLRARAYLVPQTRNDSQITSAKYRISASAPVFTPVSGTYSSDTAVTLSSVTSGAVIYYTTNGSIPTTASNVYSSPVLISGDGTTMTIRAFAAAPGLAPSSVMTESYTISYSQTSSPVINPTGGVYTADQTVAMTCSTPGSSIYYTTDGSNPTTASAPYSGSIAVSGNGTIMTIRAIAAASGYSDSAISSETFTISYPAAPAPTFSLPSGTYSSDISVVLSSGVAGATIYYTTDGTAPTTSSSVFSSFIPVAGNGTTAQIRAMLTAPGYSDSSISQETYTINYAQASTPVMNPATNSYSADQSVTLTCSTPSSTIYFTIDGSMPTTASAVYSGPIPVAGNGTIITIHAFATAPGYSDSTFASETYTISYPPAAAVQFSQPGGSYTSDTDVYLTCSTVPSQIYYTIDGSDPTTASTPYSGGPITAYGPSNTTILRAIASAPGYSDSIITQESYTVNWDQVTVPGFDQLTGTYGYSPVVVNITTPTPFATIYYSTDGGSTWTQGALLSSSATVTISAVGSTTLMAYASATGMIDSTMATATYTIIFPPTSLTYSEMSPIYLLNQVISNNVPTVTGTVTTWSVSPSLPGGLTLDPGTGVIYGTPTAAQAASGYIITAENAAGTTTATISITIDYTSPVTFNYTGTEQTFVVPAGVTSINVDATGAQGAGYNNINGSPNNGSFPPYGLGNRVQATILVTPGETLYIHVGGQSGYNGGGLAFTTYPSRPCGNGGGASDIRQGGTAVTDRVLVAAGGGGSGDGINGIGGGILWTGGYYGNLSTTLTAGTYYVAGGNASGPGDQGSPDSDGLGGSGAYGGSYGTDGTLGQGGDGGTGSSGNGGGGGGGYYGGGGGGSGLDGAGGGGGSNLVPFGGTATCGYPQTGDGVIIISW